MTAASVSSAKPYKGTNSYQIEDARLFFGREQDAELLIARILANRFTLLHAQSGAGKTSLLNARLIPGLEVRGSLPVRILPQNDPVESIRVTVTQTLLPPLEAEILALERACRELRLSGVTIGRLLEVYDDLDPGDPRQRELIRPVKVASGEREGASLVNPYFCRLLRSGVTLEHFTEHFEAIRQIGAGSLLPPLSFMVNETVEEMRSVLSDPLLASAWQKTLGGLHVPSPGLWPFFENLFQTYGRRRTRFEIILLLDQFEEIFTRFVDRGPASSSAPGGQPDWRLRRELLDEIKTLYSTQSLAPALSGDEEIPAKEYLPLRFVVSMRDEYVAQLMAQLDPERQFIPDWDAVSYHLALLTVPQAGAAIKEPASRFHYRYSEELYNTLIGQLTKEERYVEPAHLQIVCEKLWTLEARGLRARASAGARAEDREELEIGPEALEGTGGVRGILRSFFEEFLNSPEFDPGKRLEILEILEPLVTANRTRNILQMEDLVQPRFRDPLRREELLSKLVNQTIVRVEPRLGGNFVEITHEFLIEPILESIATELGANLDYTHFRMALRTLELLLPKNGVSLAGRALTLREFDALHTQAARLKWDDRAVELMLRSAILLGADRESIRAWLERFSETEWEEVKLFEGSMSQLDREAPMDLEKLRIVNQSRERIPPDTARLTWILRSQIHLATDREREDVIYWTGRLANAET